MEGTLSIVEPRCYGTWTYRATSKLANKWFCVPFPFIPFSCVKSLWEHRNHQSACKRRKTRNLWCCWNHDKWRNSRYRPNVHKWTKHFFSRSIRKCLSRNTCIYLMDMALESSFECYVTENNEDRNRECINEFSRIYF